MLGSRHRIQAAVTAGGPVADVFALGAGADALHAGSMLVLATADPAARHAVLTDALAETLFAGLGWSVSVQAREGDLPQQQP